MRSSAARATLNPTIEGETDAYGPARRRCCAHRARVCTCPRAGANLGVALEHAPDDVHVGSRRPRGDVDDARVLGTPHRRTGPWLAVARGPRTCGRTRRGVGDPAPTLRAWRDRQAGARDAQ